MAPLTSGTRSDSRLTPALADLSPAIFWLRERDVPTNRIATAFGTTQNHIRQLAFRGGHQNVRLYAPSSLDDLLNRDAANLRHRLPIRPHEDTVILSSKQKLRLAELQARVEEVASSTTEPLPVRIARLKKLLPLIGYPAESGRLGLLADVYQLLAWLYVHNGFSSSAFQHAQAAINIAHLLFRDHGRHEDLRRITEYSLIASNACLLAQDPQAALKFLDMAGQAAGRINDPLGSEHHRQRGVALFQLGSDDEARDEFERAELALHAHGEVQNAAHALVTSTRHTAILGHGDFERQLEVVAVTEREYGRGSLQYAMALNWASATGLSTDGGAAETAAIELAQQAEQYSLQFGHQSTISRLLGVTDVLSLKVELRREWVRQALYFSSFRNR